MIMRIYYINSLRLLATMAVVFLHTVAGVFDKMSITDSDSYFLLSCCKYSMLFAVPVFIMISGALFLNPAKKVGVELLLRKYVKRIGLALLIFGLPMCIIETMFSHSGGGFDALCNFVLGKSWTHMWYLYMLLGLYMITPVIKPFVAKASNKDMGYALGLLFVLSSLMPTLKAIGVDLNSYMIISSPYIFIYILGYWLCWRTSSKLLKNKVMLLAIIVVCLGFIITKCYLRMDFHGYIDPINIFLASAIFLLFKEININWSIANRWTPYCFGIYLIHPIFINFAYKFLKVSNEAVVSYFILFFLLFFLLSLCGTYILMKVPLLKKYVL